MNTKRTYTSAERRAYYMGVGVAIGYARKNFVQETMKRMPPCVKESFKNGIDDGLTKKHRFHKK